MSPDVIHGYLRGAVKEKVIWGWYRHQPLKGREWVVNPMEGPCVTYSYEEVVAFCRMLVEAEVEPIFPQHTGMRRYD